MDIRSCYFNGESGVRYDLSETDELIIVRTKEGSADSILQTIRALDPYWKHIFPFDAFPESNVYLYKCFNTPDTKAFRDEVKLIIRNSGHPLLCYVGTVLKFSGTEIYQIYTGNIFIKFYDAVGSSQISGILTRKDVEVKSLLHFGLNTYFSEPKSDIGRNVFELTQELLALPEVEYCHPELIVRTRKILLNNNPIAEPTGHTDPDWTLKKTGVFDAWKMSRGTGIKICVIDDGLDFNHPAFAGSYKIIGARDMMDKEGKRLPLHQFSERHGTACASIACSSDPRAYGIAPEASLIPIRVAGLGSVLQSEAFYWAVQQGADVISCSWGPPDGNIFIETDNDFLFPIPDHTNLAFRYASTKGRNGKGIPIIFAAGNGKEPVKNDGYAAHESVIGVGASNMADQPTVYSDFGTPMLCCFPSGDYQILAQNNVIKLDGVRVADRLGADGYTQDQYYDFFDGTSASCPGVAGVIALMLAVNPNLAQGEIKTIIKNACKKIGTDASYVNGYSQQFGYGLLMADRAVELAMNHKTLNTSRIMSENSLPNFALSLHIGINNVNPLYYKGFVPPLFGCLRDMSNMRDLAQRIGYKTLTLENTQATRKNILETIESLGKTLDPGGILLITYAGHGAPIPDSDDDEDDNQDESWVSYDGFLIDDEINNCLAKIPAGKRVVIVSDSCHSQSVTREISLTTRVRCISKDLVREILNANNQTATGLRSGIGEKLTPVAFVKLLAACQDNQFAKETEGAGVFSTRLREIFDELRNQQKTINYAEFINAINARMNDSQQVPGVLDSGAINLDFDNQHPFSIGMSVNVASTIINPVKKEPPVRQQRKNETLIVKSSKNTVKIPVRAIARTNAFLPGVQEVRISGKKIIDPPIGNSSGTIDASEIPGSNSWDKAYQVLLSNPGGEIQYVEPEIASNIYLDDFLTSIEAQRSVLSEFISTYPNPGHGPQAFTWHLDDNHSQLKRANEAVFPEIQFQDFPSRPEGIVKIAHIDTGYLPNHPALPINLDPASATFTNDDTLDGATDFDLPLSLFEQQGHGNATLSILAGGKLRDEETSGEFRGFFGAIPFARVLSLKINDTVSILSGKRFAAAVDYAIEQKCDVITMSMAGLPSKVMAEAVNKAYNHGVIIVSAAGNNFVKGIARILPTTTLYPARYPQVIAAVGAAIDEKPYLYNSHNPALRSFESEFMQMNYGPDDALKTTMAAYTPNLAWFNQKEKGPDGTVKYFIKRGGGTSSATPQIAAAAALYIQQHRDELNRIAGNDKWKIVEIVKAALFKSAEQKNPSFKKFYGNGVLRANDALKQKPADFEDQIRRAPDAEGGGNIFKRLFRIFKGRSTFGDQSDLVDERLQEMMNMEILQLLHRDPSLIQYLEQINPDDGDKALDSISDLDNFIRDIQKSDKASDFLKQRLLAPAVIDIRRGVSFDSVNSNFNNHTIKTNNGTIEIRSEGIAASVKSIATDQKIEGWEGGLFHSFEIEINGGSGSRSAAASLAITDDFEDQEMESVILIEKDVDGEKLLQWQIKGENRSVSDSVTRGLSDIQGFIESDQFLINLNSTGTEGLRGDGLKIGKLVVKVFSLFKNSKKKNKDKDSAFNQLISQMGDSKYELLIYDLNQPGGTGKDWQNLDNMPAVVATINADLKPLLVLVPGLLSTIDKGFDEFLANNMVVNSLKAKFGRYVLGYNMPTLVRGIEANAVEFNNMLTNAGLSEKKCSVVARSSGGLIARYLFEELLAKATTVTTIKPAPLVLERMILIGVANQGTPLASPQNWSNYVNIASNALNVAGLFIPLISQIVGILKAVVDTTFGLPGISDLEVGSNVILKLNRSNIIRDNYLVITSNFEPNGLLKKLFNEGIIDRLIFKGEDNDALTPVLGALFKNFDPTYSISLLPNQFHICSDQDMINHFSYLKPQNHVVISKILAWI